MEPVAAIVPPVAAQVTVEDVPPNTVAAKETVVPGKMVAAEGETTMDSAGGGGGAGVTVTVAVAVSPEVEAVTV